MGRKCCRPSKEINCSHKILALLESIGIPGAIYEEAGDLTLEAYFFSLGIKEAGGKAFLAFNLAYLVV